MKKYLLAYILLIPAVLSACSTSIDPRLNNYKSNQTNTKHLSSTISPPNTSNNPKPKSSDNTIEKSLIERYKNQTPKEWGEKVTGVKTRLDTNDKVIALTFDACGGPSGSGYDAALIDYLIKEKVPATLFINSRWIDANYNTFMDLAKNDLFEIENHGYLHRPLSINGRSEYGIQGTKNINEIFEEVLLNEDKIYKLTGRKPKFFRPGTAFCDEVAVSVVRDLGIEVAGFNVLGDAGATFSREQIKKSCLGAVPGSIIICHMNHPEKETSFGIKEVVPLLKQRGYRFVKLENYTLQ